MQKHKRKPNINPTGRQKYDPSPFIKLNIGMIKHPNFRALKGASIQVLLYIASKHSGFNNGKISASCTEMSNDLYISKATALRACEELQYFGFLKLRRKGTFLGRQASEWEITFFQCEGHLPTNCWKEAKKRKKRKSQKAFLDDISNTDEFRENHHRKIEERYLNET